MEFSECMYVLKEICEHNTCSSCPIVTMCPDGCLVSIPDHAVEAIEMAAKAYKKNKPKYPTWSEWLISIGAFNQPKYRGKIYSDIDIVYEMHDIAFKRIPPDIAEKLGISPIADDSDG